MRPSSSALQSFLLSRTPCFKADLFTITLLGGTVYRWTDFDQPVTSDTNVFLNQGPLLQRSQLGVKNTVEVPELVIRLSALDTDFLGGVGVKEQLHNGYFDGATVALERVFMPSAGDTSLGAVLLFSGRMSQAKITAVGAELTVKGANVLMNQYAPRNLFQASCIHAFCDAGCTLNAASFTTTNTVASGSTRFLIKWGSVPGSPSVYTFGMLTMTSGAASGQVRTVKLSQASGITLQYPLYNTPAPGDTFSILKGCDKSINSGSGQSCTDYVNTQHFRGYPFVPPGETAV